MKKITIYLGMFFIALLTMMSTESLHAQENLILNGDFEVNRDIDPEASLHWTRSNSDISMGDWGNPDNQINGGTCRMPGPAQGRNMYQNVEIPVAGTYTFKFTARIQNANGPNDSSPNDRDGQGPGTITATINGFDVDGETLLSDPLVTLTTQSNTNETVSADIEIPESITKVRVRVEKNWNIAFIDDVMLYGVASGLIQPSIEGLRVSAEKQSIRIASATALSAVRLYDMSGKLLQTKDLQGQIQTSINNVTKGLYLISVTDVHGNTDKIKQIIY